LIREELLRHEKKIARMGPGPVRPTLFHLLVIVLRIFRFRHFSHIPPSVPPSSLSPLRPSPLLSSPAFTSLFFFLIYFNERLLAIAEHQERIKAIPKKAKENVAAVNIFSLHRPPSLSFLGLLPLLTSPFDTQILFFFHLPSSFSVLLSPFSASSIT
jgi:hypothetical protein